MKAQKTLKTIAIALLWLTAPTLVYASGDPVGYNLTQGRLISVIAGLIGLTSVITGAPALRSSASAGFKKRMSTRSLVMGSLCTVLSLIHLANTNSGFGTGSGKAGALVAIVLGAIGMMLGGIALSRSRRSEKLSNRKTPHGQ